MTTPSPFGLNPGFLLRVESLALAAGVLAAYNWLGFGWGLFALLILAPDLAMLGYLRNERLGSLLYNAGHTLTLPAAAAAVGFALGAALPVQIALIWAAHIAFDRLLGYGLKYATDFKDTHLQRV